MRGEVSLLLKAQGGGVGGGVNKDMKIRCRHCNISFL